MIKRMRSEEVGFTLIELLVVIIIIGILAAIAIPVFLNQRKKGWDAQAKSDARNIANMEEAYLVGGTSYQDFDSASIPSTGDFSGFRASGSTITKAAANGANGYCVISKSKSGSYFVYDSLSGGLDKTTYASIPSTWTAGSSCSTAAPTIP